MLVLPEQQRLVGILSKIHMHEQSERFRTLLIDFARSIGKEDAEVYVDDGFMGRQGRAVTG